MKSLAFKYFFMLSCGTIGRIVFADEIHFRDGTILTARVSSVTSDAYIIQDGVNLPRTVPKTDIRFVYYDDAKRADQVLDLSWHQNRFAKPELKSVRVLPTKAFGATIIELIKEAKKSIYVCQYQMSGSSGEPIKSFYDTLKNQALAGLDVTVILEYGPRTPADVKFKSFEFGHELENAGAKVCYQTTPRILHKKSLVVDEEIVVLGSSNLTRAGVLDNNEINVMIRDRGFAKEALVDFAEIMSTATRRCDIQ